jgi:hypothetical protein
MTRDGHKTPAPAMRRWRRASIGAVLAVTCAWILTGVSDATVPGAPTTGRSVSAAANMAAASSAANSLLGELSLPAGAVSSADEPAGDASALARPDGFPATPDVADDTGWWILPGTPAAALAYVEAHAPAGSKVTGRSTGNQGPDGSTVSATTFSLPPVPDVLVSRELVVEVVGLTGGSTGLRADAAVVWLTPRPATEQIPPGTQRLRITVTGGFPGQRPKQRPVVVATAKRIRAAVAILNRLPVAQPGTIVCPADFAIRVRLSFDRGSRALAVAVVDPAGCEGVTLTLAGRAQPPLSGLGSPATGQTSTRTLIAQLETALGIRLDTSPPLAPSRPASR